MIVAGESLVFLANGARCPLTVWAERLGAEHGSVTDIYLPGWFAHNLPAIHVPLVLLAALLHGSNLRKQRFLTREGGPLQAAAGGIAGAGSTSWRSVSWNRKNSPAGHRSVP